MVSSSSRQDRLRLSRLKTELSESVQHYGDLQKKIAERSRALLPSAQTDNRKTPPTQPMDDSPLFGGAGGPEESDQAFFSEISEHDIEVLHQREEALVQIEVQFGPTSSTLENWTVVMTFISTRANRNSGRQGNTGNSLFFRLRADSKSVGFRLGDWVEQSRNAEPRGKDVNPRNRTVPLTAGRSDRKGLTGDEADDVAEQTGDEQQRSRGQAEKSGPGEQTGNRNTEAEVVVRDRKQQKNNLAKTESAGEAYKQGHVGNKLQLCLQVSGVELTGWEWLAGRVEQRQRDMLDVSQIMKELTTIVHEQGDTIDSIEDYIQNASSNVDSANQELTKANEYQKSWMKNKKSVQKKLKNNSSPDDDDDDDDDDNDDDDDDAEERLSCSSD
ncbi:t-SNARE domain-containing protein 1 [Takifugu flavidus]|uniref:t-SNARE domain-containing protein 1 n=1 Tax=Takifugu flavidus TaxID=433684 RepID=A0A5C6PJA7_9TELE|nr:t-SNARE domain-containing protein 1 [Takifugu flavidus]